MLLAAAVLLPWLIRRPTAARLLPLVLAAVIALVVASPQLIAMAQQEAARRLVRHASAGSSAPTASSASGSAGCSPPRPGWHFGLHGLATIYSYRQPHEALATFGLVLSVPAVVGLAAAWRRRSAWMLALLWAVGAVLALGPTLIIGDRAYVPLPVTWHGARMSLLMPYTWLMRVPGLSALREADRLALLGLVGAAMLAGSGGGVAAPPCKAADRRRGRTRRPGGRLVRELRDRRHAHRAARA